MKEKDDTKLKGKPVKSIPKALNNPSNKERTTKNKEISGGKETMSNLNTAAYWNDVWNKEGFMTWRRYPECYNRIADIVGTNKRVVDVGCGIGVLLRKLQEKNNIVYGLDISEVAIDMLKEYNNINGRVVDINEVSIEGLEYLFGEIKMDYVIATEFLEHFEEVDEVMNKLCSIGNNLILAVPNNCLGNDECKEHHQKFSKETLTKLIQRFCDEVVVEEFVDKFDSYQVPTLLARGKIKNE